MNKEFMTDAQGRQVPLDLVKDIDKLRDQTVKSLFERFQGKAEELVGFREEIVSELQEF